MNGIVKMLTICLNLSMSYSKGNEYTQSLSQRYSSALIISNMFTASCWKLQSGSVSGCEIQAREYGWFMLWVGRF